MIEKIENPLGLKLEHIESLIQELQQQFDEHSKKLSEFFSLEESGVAIEITMRSGQYSYNLEQLKLLKAQLLDPISNSIKEIS
ncbi:hypothetical protein [Acinetobacter guillouiae]|uniref:hypothetical protein n=1 Tax=Acinetobacter guillouiae TaxID=106649 RepID=UPI0028D0DBC2|nr:hypothetical protein [Acinetobacter guillouiae]